MPKDQYQAVKAVAHHPEVTRWRGNTQCRFRSIGSGPVRQTWETEHGEFRLARQTALPILRPHRTGQAPEKAMVTGVNPARNRSLMLAGPLRAIAAGTDCAAGTKRVPGSIARAVVWGVPDAAKLLLGTNDVIDGSIAGAGT